MKVLELPKTIGNGFTIEINISSFFKVMKLVLIIFLGLLSVFGKIVDY